MGAINWKVTIFVIVGALIGSFIANNVAFLNDLIPILGTSVGEIVTVVVCGGIGGAAAGMVGGRS